MPLSLVLLTGFGPFPGVPQNESARLVEVLGERAQRTFPAHRFVTKVLDTEWEAAPQRIADLIQNLEPSLALHFGVAREAQGFRIERMAQNACRIEADAAGALPRTSQLLESATASHHVTIPADAIVGHLTARGYPAHVSDDAGAYLCNAVLYQSLATCAAHSPCTRAGFIHIPADLSGPPLSFPQAVSGSLEIVSLCLSLAYTR